jgi:predicted anti-sigma-YlaC factor YlaD
VTCRDAIALLGDDLGLELRPTDLAHLSLHLAGCRSCRAYLGTYRTTSRLAREAAADVKMPDETKRRLRAFLIETLSRESR